MSSWRPTWESLVQSMTHGEQRPSAGLPWSGPHLSLHTGPSHVFLLARELLTGQMLPFWPYSITSFSSVLGSHTQQCSCIPQKTGILNPSAVLHMYLFRYSTILDVELYCRSNVRAVLRELQEQLASYTSSHSYDKPCCPGSFQDLLSQAKTEVFI